MEAKFRTVKQGNKCKSMMLLMQRILFCYVNRFLIYMCALLMFFYSYVNINYKLYPFIHFYPNSFIFFRLKLLFSYV